MAVRQEEMRLETWREIFNRHYVSRVNVQVIEAINELIGCKSDREFSNACGGDRWISHVENSGDSQRPIYYDRLRECAYFLGVPPWILVAGREGNEQIRTLFESAPSETIQVDFSGPQRALAQLTKYLTQVPLKRETRSELESALLTLEKHIPRGGLTLMLQLKTC